MNDISEDMQYQAAITIWLFEEIEKRELPYTKVEQDCGMSNDHYGRKFRNLHDGNKRWNIPDLTRVAHYFNTDVSVIIAQAELIMKSRPGDIKALLRQQAEKKEKKEKRGAAG